MRKFRTYHSTQGQLAEKVLQTLKKLDWNFTQNGQNITVDFGVSLFSWGAKLQIDVVSPHEININYRPSFPLQIVDWGEGERRIKKLIEELQKLEN